MAKGGFRWRRPPSRAWNTQLYIRWLIRVVSMELLLWSAQIEADMKRNAIWTDRTSNARQTLAVFIYQDGNRIILVAKQQMFYGKFLELNNQGKYAIVMPTLRTYYSRVWNGIRRVVA